MTMIGETETGGSLHMALTEELRRKHIQEANRRRAKIQPRVYPLALRDGTNGEISLLLEMPYGSVKNAINNMRRRTEEVEGSRRLPKPTPQSTKERRRRTLLVNKNGYTKDQLLSFEFARRLIMDGFFGADLTNWNIYHGFYIEDRRPTPPDFTYKLRGEAFVTARIALLESNKSNNMELLRKYVELGIGVNEEWFNTSFAEEEDFIASKIEYPRLGYNIDSSGFFIVPTPHGLFRQLILEDDDFDNPRLAQERERSRLRTSKP